MLAKKNTFTDFVACAQHLAKAGWTSAERIVARGGSAGGLLMGAVVNVARTRSAASSPRCRSSTRSTTSSIRRCR